MRFQPYDFGLTKIKTPNTDASSDDDEELENWTSFLQPNTGDDETVWDKWGSKCILLIVIASLVRFTYFSTNRARDSASEMKKLGNLTEHVALRTENLHHPLHNIEPKTTALTTKIFPQIN